MYPLADKVTFPTSIAFLPDSSILVSEKDGIIWMFDHKTLAPSKFYELECNIEGERGIQSLAVHPDFNTYPYVYAFYTKKDGSRDVLSRIAFDQHKTVREELLLEFDSLKGGIIHNGGGMKFSPDGTLYLAIGDHNTLKSQDLNAYYGKMIRINPDGSVPAGNPFTTGPEVTKRIWGTGLRNPYTMDINMQTGQVLANDVGRVEWEEINDVTNPGQNFGWPDNEGYVENTPFVNPLHFYPNNGMRPQFDPTERGCAITGGAFLNVAKTNYPAYYHDKYFFIDYCNGWINLLNPATREVVNFSTGLSGGALRSGPDGNLYFVNFYQSKLYKIIYNDDPYPKVLKSPDNVNGVIGKSLELRGYFRGKAPYQLRWQKDGVDLPGEQSETLTISSLTVAHSGNYRLIVANAYGADTTDVAQVVVSENTGPVVTIDLMNEGALYTAGDTIWYTGSAIDAQDGALSAETFQWVCDFHHDTHSHPGPDLVQQKTKGYFVIPAFGETATNVWYRLVLTATDSDGASNTTFVDVYPKIVNVTLQSDPEGLAVKIEREAFITPYTLSTVAGIIRTIELDTVQLQALNGRPFYFARWEDSPLLNHTRYIAPVNDTSFKFIFSTPGAVNVYPTLVKESCTIAVYVPEETTAGIWINGVNAGLAAASSHTLKAGYNELVLNTRSLKNGIYIVRLAFGGKIITRRIIKLD